MDLINSTKVGSPQEEAFANGPTTFLIAASFTIASPVTTTTTSQ